MFVPRYLNVHSFSIYSIKNHMWLQASYNCSTVPIIRPSFIRLSILSDVPFRHKSQWGTEFYPVPAVAYVEQQSQASATDIQLFRLWCDLAAKERKEALKETPCTNPLKK
jgi:hypothetical protein